MKNTDDEPRRLSFKDFTVVDYVPGEGQYINYQAQKRHRGTVGEEVEQTDEGIVSRGIAKVKAGHYDRKANKSFNKARGALGYSKGKSIAKGTSDEDGFSKHMKQSNDYERKAKKIRSDAFRKTKKFNSYESKLRDDPPELWQKESVEQTDEMSNKLLNRYSDAAKKDTKKDRAKGMRKARNIRTQRANKGLFGSDIGEEVEQVDEVYTVAQRIKAKQRMKKMSKRIQMAKKRAMKRAPSTEKLKLRARKQAKGALVSKWMRGKQKGELSFSQRQNIEKRLKSASGRIDTMSKKLLPDVRKQDRERRANANKNSQEK